MTPSRARNLLAPLIIVAVALTCSSAAVPAAGAPAAALSGTPGVVRHSATDDPDDVLSYWTEERMEAAEPLGRMVDGLTGGLLPGSGGDQETVPQSGSSSTGTPWTGGGKIVKTTGKVFLTMDGRDFTCSASVVPAGNADTVVTAGHCLKDGKGAWASKWVFVPAYDGGDAPYGRFTARELLVSSPWSRDADDSHDFGAAVLGTADGRHVREATGAQRIAFTGEGPGSVHAFGYPARSPYDGATLHYCSGSTTPDDGGTTSHGMRCDMTEGSSGGPWFSGFDRSDGTGTIVSVVSFKYAGQDGIQYGPTLDSAEKKVYDKAASL